MEDDGAHVGREDGGGRIGLADDDLRRVDDLALLVDPRHELREVVLDVELAQVLGHPAPALHVDDDALRVRARRGPALPLGLLDAGIERGARSRRQDARGLDVVLLLERFHRVLHLEVVGVLGAARHLQAQPLAQQCDMGMLAAELEVRPVRQARAGRPSSPAPARHVPAAGLQQGLAQLLELLVLGIEVAQVVAGRLAWRPWPPARPWDRATSSFTSMSLLICAGSRRPPRAWRAYLRAARPSLISAPASASGAVAPGASCGSSKAEAGSPQSSALRISAMAWLALAVKPSPVTQSRGSLRAA